MTILTSTFDPWLDSSCTWRPSCASLDFLQSLPGFGVSSALRRAQLQAVACHSCHCHVAVVLGAEPRERKAPDLRKACDGVANCNSECGAARSSRDDSAPCKWMLCWSCHPSLRRISPCAGKSSINIDHGTKNLVLLEAFFIQHVRFIPAHKVLLF